MSLNPKDKAKELVDKYFDILYCINIGEHPVMDAAKECALIAVDEILAMKKEFWDDLQDDYFKWWQEVKQEIEKL